MSGYARNPSSPSDPGYASLTAGLLARKGEAMPAVDADAHAGVDIDMHQAVTANVANKGFTRQTTENLYPPKSSGSHGRPDQLNDPQQNTSAPNTIREHHTPSSEMSDTWSVSSSIRRLSMRREKPRLPDAENAHQRKATVRFRMSVEDFVRMRFASRDMEMSCQSIILEALDCYLDANDIMPVTKEECKAELDRLAQASARKRAASKVLSVAE